MPRLRTEKVRIAQSFNEVRQAIKQLDSTNIKILSAMWKFGPRNLLEVSRRTGIPFTSVYHRAAKLEKRSRRIAYLIPRISKLGMVRVVVLVAAKAGAEERVLEALKIPNFWWSINPCEGNFTHHSVHAVPVKFLQDFKSYVRHLASYGLITHYRFITTGEQYPNFPNFKNYDPSLNEWKFPWGRWLEAMSTRAPSSSIDDPRNYSIVADRKDLLIIKELEKDARKTFADLAPVVGVTLQGVKYHYDKILIPNDIVKNFDFVVHPYPVEVSAFYEIMLEFCDRRSMNRFFSLVYDLFFVRVVSKVLHKNTLLVRTYILQYQLMNMFRFFSEMAKLGMLKSYSAIRLNFEGRISQTISYELFDDELGWMFDLKHSLSELRKLAKAKTPIASAKTRMHSS